MIHNFMWPAKAIPLIFVGWEVTAFDISIPPTKCLKTCSSTKKKGIDIGCLISHSKLRIYSILTYCLLVQMIKYEDYETQSLSKKKASAFCVAPS